jgi:hypothetical protein
MNMITQVIEIIMRENIYVVVESYHLTRHFWVISSMTIESNNLEFAFYFDIKHSIVGIHLSKLDDEIWLTLSYDGQLIEIYEYLKKDETIKDTIKLEKFESEEKQKIVIDKKIKNLISEAIEFMKYNLSLQEKFETVKELKEIYEVKISAHSRLEKLRKKRKIA